MTDNGRIDKLMVELNLVASRAKAQSLIKAGAVQVNGKIVNKANCLVRFDSVVKILNDPCVWVSRGGLKLAGAIAQFKIDITDKVCLDIGASTGGFCDVLLANGALRIFAVDVGHSQLHPKIRQDEKVVVMEKTDVRELNENTIPPLDIVVCDVSFVSVAKIIQKPLALLKPNGVFLILIKPQFEVGKSCVGKGGIVKDQTAIKAAINNLKTFFNDCNCLVKSVVPAQISGGDGNQEYILYGIKL